jgi:hypothetical protein
MAISPKYVLVCDEARQEITGKFIIIGLYQQDLVTAQLPVVLPGLTFFVGVESDKPGNYQCRITLQHLESGQTVAEGMGGFGIQRPGFGSFPIRLPNLQLNAVGAYLFSLTIDGEKDPITASFNIILNVAQPGRATFPLPPSR